MIHNHEVPGSIPGPATRLRFRLLGGFHSWRSFLFFTLGLRYGLQGSTDYPSTPLHPSIHRPYRVERYNLHIFHNITDNHFLLQYIIYYANYRIHYIVLHKA